MVTDSSAMQHGESLIAAEDRIQTGPVPGWVEACTFPMDGKSSQAGQVTYLLFDRQIHSELRQTYFHVALRLDTMQAVQDQSPWRSDFEPGQQQITLHSIKTWRAGGQFDHADLSSARLVDRRAAGSLRQDRLTLLLMLEGIRPGDILEWSYTIESQPLLLPEYCASIFSLPAGVPVGKFYFSLRFNHARPMRWKFSVPEWQPVEKQDNGGLLWVWTQDNYGGLPPEENAPDWHVAHPWIQISDCPDWGTIAAAFAEAWKEDEDDVTVREIAGEIAAGECDILQQTERAIQMVQDEYRSLAADGELDDQPPMPLGTVARRRYGDCKDLSFLLAHLLKRLGVPAHLVLVSTTWRKSIAELLPAPGVFNHLLVEYQVRGETRWVEAALKSQGSLRLRAIRDYGAGLPMTGLAARLAEPPGDSAQSDVYELNESILLDTSGDWSWLAVVVAARGSAAEALREELEREGLDALAKKRLRDCADRFTKVRRVGALQYRDDRAANEFFLAEIFEIKDFLTLDPKSKWYKLDLPNDYIANCLKVPEAGPRRAAFALPHARTMVHTIELHSVALASAYIQRRKVQTDYLSFLRLRKTLAGYWTMKLTLSTPADAVPPEFLEKHREAIKKIRAQSTWSLLVPPGDRRPHQRGDFGALPNPRYPARPRSLAPTPPEDNGAPASVAEAVAPAALENGIVSPPPSPEPVARKLKRRKRRRHKRGKKAAIGWPVMAGCILALTLILILILVTRNADHWNIFRRRPPPPTTPVNTFPAQ